MRPLFGPRTVVEAAFIVAVPVIALEVGLKIWGIVIAGTIAYLLVVLVELGYWYEGKRKPLPAAAASARTGCAGGRAARARHPRRAGARAAA